MFFGIVFVFYHVEVVVLRVGFIVCPQVHRDVVDT